MKKLLYICLLAFVSSMAITSCTEEVIAPQEKGDSNGGSGIHDRI